MSTHPTRNTLLAACLCLLSAPLAPTANAADHREAPILIVRGTGTVARCPQSLHLPILFSVHLPDKVLRDKNVPMSFITRGADGDVDATDYDIWQDNYGTTVSGVLNPSIMQSSEVFMAFPAADNRDYRVTFEFQSVEGGDKCTLTATVAYELEPVQVVSYHVGGGI